MDNEELTEQQIKAKIAYSYRERLKAFNPHIEDDSQRDWNFACRVWEHFKEPIQPTSAKWLSQREDYEQYQRYF